ncbi:MAG TPA: BrxE family protein [Thermoanaerobaculia bacterium]|nr:BrxE family protein [Thermoanaerobaculia bacterium]
MPIDLDHLLKLRLVVGRYGEMDLAKWWNTRGQLGSYGTSALRRGFPRTHYFAQARSVFAVAAHRCAQVFEDPRSVTLWRLPETLEEEFDARWEHWLDHGEDWAAFFAKLETLEVESLIEVLRGFALASPEDAQACSRLTRSPGIPAVALSGVFRNDDVTATLLALGFARGGKGDLAVPFIRREDR